MTDSCALSPSLRDCGVDGLPEFRIHDAREYQSPLSLSKPLRVGGRGLKRVPLCVQKKDMTSDADLASLRHEELRALVQQLRQQLAERDQEIEQLKRQSERRALSASDESIQKAAPSVPDEPSSGSQKDLLAQLEKIYPPR